MPTRLKTSSRNRLELTTAQVLRLIDKADVDVPPEASVSITFPENHNLGDLRKAQANTPYLALTWTTESITDIKDKAATA